MTTTTLLVNEFVMRDVILVSSTLAGLELKIPSFLLPHGISVGDAITCSFEVDPAATERLRN